MTTFLSSEYWTNRYLKEQIGWDIGNPSEPLKQYLDQIPNKSLKILIPGAGNAYEAGYAFKIGFNDIHVLDFSHAPLIQFRQSCPNFPEFQIYEQDFFDHQGSYDLILEQTFFCALDPSLRAAYVQKIKSLLKPKGKLVGVLFAREFEKQGPPFGGSVVEYQKLFEESFQTVVIQPCYNSIPPRMGSEVFIQISNPKSN